jgi:hypothetical protein
MVRKRKSWREAYADVITLARPGHCEHTITGPARSERCYITEPGPCARKDSRLRGRVSGGDYIPQGAGVGAVAGERVTIRVENCNGYTKGFVADVDGGTSHVIPSIKVRVEGDGVILLIFVVGSRRVDRSANNE